jgi:hypothetical protein
MTMAARPCRVTLGKVAKPPTYPHLPARLGGYVAQSGGKEVFDLQPANPPDCVGPLIRTRSSESI